MKMSSVENLFFLMYVFLAVVMMFFVGKTLINMIKLGNGGTTNTISVRHKDGGEVIDIRHDGHAGDGNGVTPVNVTTQVSKS